MRCLPENAGSRREFFRAGARYGLAVGLAVVAGVSAARGRKLAGQKCVNRGVCSGCVAFAGCGLPQALSVKRVKGA